MVQFPGYELCIADDYGMCFPGLLLMNAQPLHCPSASLRICRGTDLVSTPLTLPVELDTQSSLTAA